MRSSGSQNGRWLATPDGIDSNCGMNAAMPIAYAYTGGSGSSTAF
jgi:hypothetical protein